MIPTTPWEAVWNGVAEWWGLDGTQRAEPLPNMANFPEGDIFDQSQLYRK